MVVDDVPMLVCSRNRSRSGDAVRTARRTADMLRFRQVQTRKRPLQRLLCALRVRLRRRRRHMLGLVQRQV